MVKIPGPCFNLSNIPIPPLNMMHTAARLTIALFSYLLRYREICFRICSILTLESCKSPISSLPLKFPVTV